MTTSQIPRHGTEGDVKSRQSRLHATRSPRFPTVDGRPRRPTLPFWQLWTQFGLSPRRVAWRSFGAKCMGVSIGLRVHCMWNGRSDLQAGAEIYHWGYFPFWLLVSSQNDPCSGPQFQPPVRSVRCPISLCPRGTLTKSQVVHPDIGPRSCLLSPEPWGLPWLGGAPVRMTQIFVILAS